MTSAIHRNIIMAELHSLLRLVLFLQVLVWACTAVQISPCSNHNQIPYYYEDVAVSTPERTGDSDYYAIGAFFDVHQKGQDAFSCGTTFSPVGLLYTQVFLWSIGYWKAQISAQVSIGGFVMDSCMRQEQLIQNMLGFEQCNIRIKNIDRRNVVGFVGPLSNADAIATAKLANDLDMTIISPSANARALSNRTTYPTFLRTVPSIDVDIEIMSFILGDKLGVRCVAAIYEMNLADAFEQFKMQMTNKGICVNRTKGIILEDPNAMLDTFINQEFRSWADTKFVALLLSSATTEMFLNRLKTFPDLREKYIFLMTSDVKAKSSFLTDTSIAAFATNSIQLERTYPDDINTTVQAFRTYWLQLNESTLGVQISNPWLVQYLRTGNRLLSVDDYTREVASTVMATKALILGMRSASASGCSLNPNDFYLCLTFLNKVTRGDEVYTKTRSESGYFVTDSTSNDLKNSLVKYKVYRQIYSNFELMGYYTPGEQGKQYSEILAFLPNEPRYRQGTCSGCPYNQTTPTMVVVSTAITTSTVASNCKDSSYGNYTMVAYPQGQEITGAFDLQNLPRTNSEKMTRFEIGQRWIIALGVLAGLGILCVVVFEIYILYKLLGTQIGRKWRTMWLGQLLLFGIFLCYLTLFAYLPVPTKATCGITRFGVGVSLAICFAVLLVKLMVILTSRSSDSSLLPSDGDSPNYLKGIYQFLMFIFAVGVQVVIDVQWLITIPPEAVKVVANNGQEVWVCNHYTWRASADGSWNDMASFVRNEFENHVLSLVYIMFLILITTILALRAHGIITNHRESIFIGIASGFSIPVWLAWTLVGGLNRTHSYAQEFGDGCIAFGLFLTATLILFAMFLPKVRQLVSMGVEGIYYEDDHETVYGGSVIMGPPSYKSRPNSVIYVNNQGIYSDPIIVGNGDPSMATYLRHPGSHPSPASIYSAPPTYLKKGADSTLGGGSRVLRVTGDLNGKHPSEKRRTQSEFAYGTMTSRPRSTRGTLPRSRSHTNLGAL